MSGGTYEHSLIATNINAQLHAALLERPCVAHGSDMRIHIARTGRYVYSDALVVCGEPRFTDLKRFMHGELVQLIRGKENLNKLSESSYVKTRLQAMIERIQQRVDSDEAPSLETSLSPPPAPPASASFKVDDAARRIGSSAAKGKSLKYLPGTGVHTCIQHIAAGQLMIDNDARLLMYQAMCDELQAAPVQAIGKLLVLYRAKPDEPKPAAKTRKPAGPRKTKKQMLATE